jgi:iron complex transport system ATP-binding protein
MENMVEFRDVAVWRGENRVLDGLTLDLPLGQSTAILGPNGSGKSTLLKLLSCELYPEHREGSLMRIFGRERWNVWELRTRLGVVSNDLQTQYAGSATGWDVLLSGYTSTPRIWPHHRFTDLQRARVDELFQTLGISHLKEKLYSTMSTGEQRRLLLGRALVHDPAALVLDEPTSGLDIQGAFGYLETVRLLMHSGRTVVLVTHHIHEIPPEVERVILLRSGRIFADGSKIEVLTSEILSELFGVGIDVVEANGFYQAFPGSAA